MFMFEVVRPDTDETGNVEKHVGGLRIVEVGVQSEQSAPEADVYADVVLGVLLPAQVVVGDLFGVDLRGESVAQVDVRRAVERQVFRIADLGIAVWPTLARNFMSSIHLMPRMKFSSLMRQPMLTAGK